MTDPMTEFQAAIDAAGFTAPAEILADGRVHRFSPNGRRGDDAGWYVLHLDNVPAGVFGDWRSNESQTWCAKSENSMSAAERRMMIDRIKESKRLRDQERANGQAHAAARAESIWSSAVPAVGHPYLIRKRVTAAGLRIGPWSKLDRETGEIVTLENVLLIPVRDSSGKLWSLQGIDVEGGKLFLVNGKNKGCYHSIGRPSGRVIVAEGITTAATVHAATGDAVAVAFNASNLEPVARALRAKFPCLSIVIAADDDWQTRDPRTGELSNPGLKGARAAAAAVGGLVAVPDFTGLPRERWHTDFNDVACLAGAVILEVQG